MEHREETIRMILPQAGNGPYVEGALNGVNFRIPTGVPVDVPLHIYRVLEESRRVDPAYEQWVNGFTAAGGQRLK